MAFLLLMAAARFRVLGDPSFSVSELSRASDVSAKDGRGSLQLESFSTVLSSLGK